MSRSKTRSEGVIRHARLDRILYTLGHYRPGVPSRMVVCMKRIEQIVANALLGLLVFAGVCVFTRIVFEVLEFMKSNHVPI